MAAGTIAGSNNARPRSSPTRRSYAGSHVEKTGRPDRYRHRRGGQALGVYPDLREHARGDPRTETGEW